MNKIDSFLKEEYIWLTEGYTIKTIWYKIIGFFETGAPKDERYRDLLGEYSDAIDDCRKRFPIGSSTILRSRIEVEEDEFKELDDPIAIPDSGINKKSPESTRKSSTRYEYEKDPEYEVRVEKYNKCKLKVDMYYTNQFLIYLTNMPVEDLCKNNMNKVKCAEQIKRDIKALNAYMKRIRLMADDAISEKNPSESNRKIQIIYNQTRR